MAGSAESASVASEEDQSLYLHCCDDLIRTHKLDRGKAVHTGKFFRKFTLEKKSGRRLFLDA
jgi:hypothetical protein